MRAGDRYAEHLSRQHVGRGTAAADIRGARAVSARVGTLRAAQTEFEYLRVRTGAQPCRRRSNERLMVDDGEQRRFDELSLEYRRGYRQNRLGREKHRPLRQGADIPRETEIFQPFQKVVGEYAEGAEVRKVFFLETQIGEILHRLLQSRRHGVRIAAAPAVEQVEYRPLFAQPLLQIAVGHRELIEVGEHGQIAFRRKRCCHCFFSSDEIFSAGYFGSFHATRTFLM